MNTKTSNWLRGLFGGVIGGMATAGSAWLGMAVARDAGLDVPELNWKAMLIILVVGGLSNLFAYLKQSPLPPPEDSAAKMLCVAFSIAFMLAATGCSTVTPDARVQRMANVAELATFTAVSLDLADNPIHKQYYLASAAALSTLLRDGNYSPAAFADALKELPVKRLSGEKGAIIVGTAVILWDQYAAEVVTLDQAKYVRPVIAATLSGLDRALGK